VNDSSPARARGSKSGLRERPARQRDGEAPDLRAARTSAAPALADQAALYRAMQSRDHRFEGRFIAGVTSTGIYCRPGCPAKMPRAENVRFFACAAAAEGAGFRACLRCRPDASALLPAAAGSSATVTRALGLMSQGEQELSALCDKLGVGPRHLRRLFVQHLGASPQAVLRTQRLQFARQLLEQTRLPMTEVALASGFRSTRRFNAEIRRAFQAPPRELRAAPRGSMARQYLPESAIISRKAAPGADARDRIELRIPYAPPLDWPALLSFFGARAIAGVEQVEGLGYRRSVRVAGSGTPLLLEVAPVAGAHALRVSLGAAPAQALPALVAGVKRMFGCAVQPHAVAAHLGRDPLLARALALHPGLRVPGAWDPFELAVRALLGQQISVRAAQTLAGRLVQALGEALPRELASEGGLTHLFPTPQTIAEAGSSFLQSLGLMPARAVALHGLAQRVASGALDFAALRARPLEEAGAALESLPGFGAWSAHYIALRALGEPDAFPLRDLGLLRSLRREQPGATFSDLRARAESWRPFRATAAIALWLLDSSPLAASTGEP